MNLLNIKIITDHLRLLPTSEQYAEDIFKEFTSELTIHMFPKPADKIEETISFIQSSREKMQKGEELQVVIQNKETNEFIGHGGIHGINTETPELGIWIKVGAHGHKYGREAVTGLKSWIDKNIKYTHITYPVDRNNIASRKIVDSLGGIVKKEYKKQSLNNTILDIVEYLIYPSNKK